MKVKGFYKKLSRMYNKRERDSDNRKVMNPSGAMMITFVPPVRGVAPSYGVRNLASPQTIDRDPVMVSASKPEAHRSVICEPQPLA